MSVLRFLHVSHTIVGKEACDTVLVGALVGCVYLPIPSYVSVFKSLAKAAMQCLIIVCILNRAIFRARRILFNKKYELVSIASDHFDYTILIYLNLPLRRPFTVGAPFSALVVQLKIFSGLLKLTICTFKGQLE